MESLGINNKFWLGKRVFLTGHTGFKGGWLSLWLQSLGAVITGYALKPNTEPNFFTAAQIEQGMNSVIADIRDLDRLKEEIKKANPEIVIHMAAQPLVRHSYLNPIETFETNVMGTVHVLEASRENKNIKVILNITSDKCYENNETFKAYKETDSMGGFDPYSSSKACAELVSSSYRNSFFNVEQYPSHKVALATARAGNVIGGGDWSEDRLIPDFIKAIEKKQKVYIRNPNAIRPWQHVLEPLYGYLKLIENLYEKGPQFSGAWNFGPRDTDAKSVKSIVEYLAKTWGSDAIFDIQSDVLNLHEAQFLQLDCTKSFVELDWQPKWDIHMAIESLCSWHKAFLQGGNMRNFSLNEIDAYSSQSI
jgi:CDP-glucose 4,6-dehydratase